MRIGRGPQSDIRLLGDPSVSRLHAELILGQPLQIVDCGSRNGTLMAATDCELGNATVTAPLADAKALEPRAPHVVREGDELLIGAASLRLLARLDHRREQPSEAPIIVDERTLRVDEMVARLAPSELSLLLLGESGAGKDVFARRAHALSPRRDHTFMSINCGALVETLLESELFGHERGAFTGAQQTRAGLLEAASGGTVFLDEIGELPLSLQVKLLRVLEERRVMRIGGRTSIPIDVRFISATNRDLPADVRDGRFRRDLYFRINGVSIVIPPLRERPGDLAPLATALAERAANRAGVPAPTITPTAMALLRSHSWPGNIRELRNAMERAVAFSGGGPIEAHHVALDPLTAGAARGEEPSVSLPAEARLPIGGSEKTRIVAALDHCAGNQTRAAQMLGMTRRMLVRRLEKYSIPRPRANSR